MNNLVLFKMYSININIKIVPLHSKENWRGVCKRQFFLFLPFLMESDTRFLTLRFFLMDG
jgi:hypothetical protein